MEEERQRERSGWLAQNLMTRFDKRSLPEARPRTRFLSRDEYRRLLAVSGPHLRPLIEMAVETGMRLEELLSLRWEQVDLDRREVRLVVTKSRQPRVIPLSERSVAIVVASPCIAGSPYVFTNPGTGKRYRNVWRSFRRACSRAGISDFRWHDLRHTFASWHVQSGTDLYRLSRMLGHSTLQMSARYAHLATEHLHQAVRDMATSVATVASDYSHAPQPQDHPSSS
jgi:integrase/recombinase XerD